MPLWCTWTAFLIHTLPILFLEKNKTTNWKCPLCLHLAPPVASSSQLFASLARQCQSFVSPAVFGLLLPPLGLIPSSARWLHFFIMKTGSAMRSFVHYLHRWTHNPHTPLKTIRYIAEGGRYGMYATKCNSRQKLLSSTNEGQIKHRLCSKGKHLVQTHGRENFLKGTQCTPGWVRFRPMKTDLKDREQERMAVSTEPGKGLQPLPF